MPTSRSSACKQEPKLEKAEEKLLQDYLGQAALQGGFLGQYSSCGSAVYVSYPRALLPREGVRERPEQGTSVWWCCPSLPDLLTAQQPASKRKRFQKCSYLMQLPRRSKNQKTSLREGCESAIAVRWRTCSV